MQIPIKKLKNGFEIPSLWIGTWKMWGTSTRDKNNDDIKDIVALRYSISKGLTCIDSAEIYAGGYSEVLLWKAVENIPRKELFLSSKVRWDNCSYAAIKRACQNSLKRLWVEYLDLYDIHWRDYNFSLEYAMKAMNELVDEGLIKYIWVSNFSVESLKEAQKYSKYPIVANQVHFNLLYREPERSGLLQYCQENDIMLIAWSPLKYWEEMIPISWRIINSLSQKYKKTPFQLALNWIISHPNVTTLFMSRNPSNIVENIWSLWWTMSQSDYDLLRREFPNQKDISDHVPLA
jgi:diketogulonate reductase-like aldo/keto reductase